MTTPETTAGQVVRSNPLLAEAVEPLLKRFFASDDFELKHGFIANRAEECKWGALWFLEWLRSDKANKEVKL